MMVEISAFKNEEDDFIVNYLETKSADETLQLVGTITTLDTDNERFTLGELIVDYSNVDLEETLVIGALAEIKSEQGLVDNIFVANDLSIKAYELNVDDTFELSGVIEHVEKSFDDYVITIDSKTFLITDDSEFSQGDDDDLLPGNQITLTTQITESGHYPVSEVRVELVNELSLEGVVEAVSADTFTLFSQTFSVDNFTQYEDDSSQDIRHFTFTDIAIGDRLTVEAFDVNGQLISRKVEREETGTNEQDTEEEHEIEGVVDDIDITAFSFSVKGIEIKTNHLTEFEDSKGDMVDQIQFFEQLTLEQTLEVELTQSENGWVATEVEIEEQHNEAGDSHNTEEPVEVEIEGIVDTIMSADAFTLNGHQIVLTQETRFDNGEASDIQIGVELSVEGYINSEGVLVAQEIEISEIDDD